MATFVDITLTDRDTFRAYNRATTALHGCGFSVGRMQARAPTGVLFGQFDIQKWRNLRADDRAQLHGTIEGNFRDGPVRLRVIAPSDDVAARLRSALEGPQP